MRPNFRPRAARGASVLLPCLLLGLLAAACSAPARSPVLPNRDPHGARDVAHYIEALESDQRVRDLQVDLVIERLALPPDAVVGDLGCGPGVFSVPFGRAVPAGLVYAADVEPRQLDRLSAKLAEGGVHNVIPVLASLDDPHFPPGGLDLVFIGDTLHHLQDRVAYLRRLQGCLKPGGRVAVLEYKPGDLPVGPPAAHKLAPGELERTLSEAGYVRVESFDTHPYHDFEVWRVEQPWER
jgi:ubiquinone/menaquinone biosynthesis C-methylase UbiE